MTEPVFHLRSYGDVSAADLDAYAARRAKQPTTERQLLEQAREALIAARPYVEEASVRRYDGTRGPAIREHAGKRLDQIDAATAAIDAHLLEVDARRYRWLRGRLPGSAYRIAEVIYSDGGSGVDAAIDAAIAAESAAS